MELKIEEAETLLKQGGFVKRAAWLMPMHVRYNKSSNKYDLVDSVSLYEGGSGLGILSSYDSLKDVPYVGKWLPCTNRGELL